MNNAKIDLAREMQLRELVNKLKLPIQNITLLDVALTHTSYTNEHKDQLIHHNERLEFLGDAVLDLIVGEYLFLHNPNMNEGELTRAKAFLVCEHTLAECSQNLNYGEYLLLGRGEKHSGGSTRPSILADTFEAVIGAIYLDTDFETTHNFVLLHLKKYIDKIDNSNYDEDYKTALQECVQRNGDHKIEYRLKYSLGPDHSKSFCIEVLVKDKVLGTGIGRSKKEAQQKAAKEAYMKLNA